MCVQNKINSGERASGVFRRAALALAISAVFASVATVAGEKLDMSFIQAVPELIRRSGRR